MQNIHFWEFCAVRVICDLFSPFFTHVLFASLLETVKKYIHVSSPVMIFLYPLFKISNSSLESSTRFFLFSSESRCSIHFEQTLWRFSSLCNIWPILSREMPT